MRELIVKNKIIHSIIIVTFIFAAGLLSSCGTIRAMYGIPEPQESEASIRKKITKAIDEASSDIIRSLPSGIRLAVLGGSSSVNDQETAIAYMKTNLGYSDDVARAAVREMDKVTIATMAAQARTMGWVTETSYADYAVEDLEFNLVKAGFRLVDRQQIERIRNEQQFQLSGEVDDNSAVSIGKMAGANSVIVISVVYADKSGRLTLKALDVETAEITAMARQEF